VTHVCPRVRCLLYDGNVISKLVELSQKGVDNAQRERVGRPTAFLRIVMTCEIDGYWDIYLNDGWIPIGHG
jgi:hypothetical protein